MSARPDFSHLFGEGTKRRAVVELRAQGVAFKDIAARIGISTDAAVQHMSHALSKARALGVDVSRIAPRSRAQRRVAPDAIARAAEARGVTRVAMVETLLAILRSDSSLIDAVLDDETRTPAERAA